MDAILLTGGIPKPDKPLYRYTQGMPKAMLVYKGKTLLQRVLDALSDAQRVSSVLVIGPDMGAKLECSKPLRFLELGGGMMDKFVAGMMETKNYNPEVKHFFLISSDLPLIEGHMIDWVIEKSLQGKGDAFYPLVRSELMDERFPATGRMVVRFRDIDIFPAAMGVITGKTLDVEMDFWHRVEEARKSIWQGAALFGYINLLGMLLRWFTLDQAVGRVARKLGFEGQALLSPHPEIVYDIDEDAEWEYLLEHADSY